MTMSEEQPKTTGIKKLDRRLIAGALAVFVAGWFLGQQGVSPWTPEKDRPVLRFMAKVAKTGLWLLVVEPVPEDVPEYTVVADHNKINHRRGW